MRMTSGVALVSRGDVRILAPAVGPVIRHGAGERLEKGPCLGQRGVAHRLVLSWRQADGLGEADLDLCGLKAVGRRIAQAQGLGATRGQPGGGQPSCGQQMDGKSDRRGHCLGADRSCNSQG